MSSAPSDLPVRISPDSVTGNRAEMQFERLVIRSTGEAAADLSLHGSLMESGPGIEATEAKVDTAPRDNVLQVRIAGSSGSGPRANVYSHSTPPGAAAADRDSLGNRIEFVGSAEAFLRSNTNFVPAPSESLFVSVPVSGASVPDSRFR